MTLIVVHILLLIFIQQTLLGHFIDISTQSSFTSSTADAVATILINSYNYSSISIHTQQSDFIDEILARLNTFSVRLEDLGAVSAEHELVRARYNLIFIKDYGSYW